MSDPEGALSAGIIVQDFQVQSTNDKWEATFVARDDKKAAAAVGAKAGAIYKKASRSFIHSPRCSSPFITTQLTR